MSSPLVSVIIPNYNYARYLPQAVDSALAQTYPSVEVIVVDDGSTDESGEVLRSYGGRIRAFRRRNGGVAAARNFGASQAEGDFVAFLDADDFWLPEKLERQVGRWLADRGLGLVHCGVQDVDAAGRPLGVHLDGGDGWLAKDMLLFSPRGVLGGGSGVLLPRAVFSEVGGFDERLSTSADWDFFFRVAVRRRVGFVPEVLLRYRVHGSNMHANVGLMERDMLLAYEKAFEAADAEVLRLRRKSYGKLHMVLAGSYFHAGQYADSARHAFKSLRSAPGNGRHLSGFLLRWCRRRLAGHPGGH